VSSVSGQAAVTDPNLINPGASRFRNQPLLGVGSGSNVSTLYSSSGTKVSLVVSVPGGPTGQVFNSAGPGNFVDGASAASFLFATQGVPFTLGTVPMGRLRSSKPRREALRSRDWRSPITDLGIFFTLRMIRRSPAESLRSTPALLKSRPAVVSRIPTARGLCAFNIQTINGLLYVEYASTGGSGAVDVFDANGNFIQRLITGGQLDDPWGS